MASVSTEAATAVRDVIGHDDSYDFIAEEEEDEEDDDEEDEEQWGDMSKRMARLSMEGSDGGDADDENDDEEGDDDDVFDEARSDVNGAATTYRHAREEEDLMTPAAVVPTSASLPGTPDRGWAGMPSGKEYASETEARAGRRRHHHRRRERVMREVWLERAWRMKQRRQLMEGQAAGGEVPVVVLGGGGDEHAAASSGSRGGGGVAMDMEEMRACRDLGLDLPCDWTVEIPCCYALSGVDTASSGGNSPASAGSWLISSPGDDPRDVKARLKVWAQAVALASASRLGS